jgi:hypothetical protein
MMPNAKSKMGESVQASLGMSAGESSHVGLGGVFTVTCFDKEGNLKWEEKFHNLVVNEGLVYLNNTFFKSNGGTYTAAWYLGLVTGPGSGTSYSATDTLASHSGWTEFTAYSGNRKLLTFGTPTSADPSVIDNSASPAIFSITAPGGTVAGAFLTNVATGTSGTLFSEGDFSTDKIVAASDTINVTYTFSADAA